MLGGNLGSTLYGDVSVMNILHLFNFVVAIFNLGLDVEAIFHFPQQSGVLCRVSLEHKDTNFIILIRKLNN